jgi:hypothetical protein
MRGWSERLARGLGVMIGAREGGRRRELGVLRSWSVVPGGGGSPLKRLSSLSHEGRGWVRRAKHSRSARHGNLAGRKLSHHQP